MAGVPPVSASAVYLQLLTDMADLHARKSAGYSGADNPDPWANFRRSEHVGVKASTGALIRLLDKVSRVETLMRSPDSEQVGESIEDTLIDLAAYALIVVCLRREEAGATRHLARCECEPPHKSAWQCPRYIRQDIA
jgi:hypothetical protein